MGDVLRLTWDQWNGLGFVLTQSKTKEAIAAPILSDDLRDQPIGMVRDVGHIVLSELTGQPYNMPTFHAAFAKSGRQPSCRPISRRGTHAVLPSARPATAARPTMSPVAQRAPEPPVRGTLYPAKRQHGRQHATETEAVPKWQNDGKHHNKINDLVGKNLLLGKQI